MPKKTEFTTDDELTKAVTSLLADDRVPQLQPLRDNEVNILCCFKVRMDDNGETEPPKGCPVKLKKLSDLERLFIEGNAHYILTADYHWWKNSNERQQAAGLFDTLMDIKPEPTESGLKLKKRESGIPVKHPETLALFGVYDEPTLFLRDCMRNVSRRLTGFVDDFIAPQTEEAAGETEPQTEQETEPEAEGEPEPVPKKKAAVKK